MAAGLTYRVDEKVSELVSELLLLVQFSKFRRPSHLIEQESQVSLKRNFFEYFRHSRAILHQTLLIRFENSLRCPPSLAWLVTLPGQVVI